MMRLCFLLVIVFCITGCGQKNEISLEGAVAQYREKSGAGTDVISRALLETTASRIFNTASIKNQGQCLYYARGTEISVIFPFDVTLQTEKSDEVFISCSMSDMAVSRNGEAIDMYNPAGERTSSFTLDDPTDRIKAHLIVDNTVYYYRGHNIYRKAIDGISSSLDDNKPFITHAFNPPYKQYYEVALVHEDDKIGVIVGSAGYYYINILSLDRQKLLVSNISASSSKASIKNSYVHYITGGSGRWQLISFNYTSKDKSEIRKFKTIRSIELLDEYYIFNDTHGLWLQEYSRDIIKVPFDYALEGKYNGSVLLGYNEQLYVVDPAVLRAKLDELKLELPELFN